MKGRKVLLTLAIIFFSQIYSIQAICSDGQIDVNTATLEELDSLYGIGPVKAQAIIDGRPIVSIESLIDVNGIGPATLEGIKAQGLACVENEEAIKEGNNEVEDNISTTGDKGLSYNENTSGVNNLPSPNEYQQAVQPKVIELNPLNSKDINTEKSNEKLSAERYAISGFVAFSILIVFLLFINRRKKHKLV